MLPRLLRDQKKTVLYYNFRIYLFYVKYTFDSIAPLNVRLR